MTNSKVFSISDNVVYPSHGVGRIVDIETQNIGGMSLELLVIKFTQDKMSLKIPVNKARKTGLRHLSTPTELDKTLTILKEKPKRSKGMWSKRATEYETKIHSGDLSLLAEVVRDLFKSAESSERSYSEKVLYELALSRLSSEYALLHDIAIDLALEKLLLLLKSRDLVAA
ncbi:MAG: CarD family transcriptional regulator [Rickettsiales bacterium]|nr:CarD family transcriptional regulator [Rickettsiales bacterium]